MLEGEEEESNVGWHLWLTPASCQQLQLMSMQMWLASLLCGWLQAQHASYGLNLALTFKDIWERG